MKADEPLRCASCFNVSRLTTGAEVFPHLPELRAMPYWMCVHCGAHVGCKPGTAVPTGRPANAALRRARQLLMEERIHPLWDHADESGLYAAEDEKARQRIRGAARHRVFAFLADRMGIEPELCRVGLFTIDDCRQAWTVLAGVAYGEIRDWAKARDIGAPKAETVNLGA